eukprot:1161408-Pelagomonas_calceolata.AAC.12
MPPPSVVQALCPHSIKFQPSAHVAVLHSVDGAVLLSVVRRATTHTHGMGSCPEITHYQEAALNTTGPVGGHPTCPAGSIPHNLYQQPGPMGSCPESTLSRMPGLWDSISRRVESVIGAMRGVAQQVAARWTGNSGATDRDMAVPLGRLQTTFPS